MTKEEIVTLVVANDLVEEVYDTLHFIIMAELAIKKFADANKLDVIKDILAESEEKNDC